MKHDPLDHRFVIDSGGQVAELVYQRTEEELVMVHTWVPVDLRNHGLAARLVEAAAEFCRQEGLVAVAGCSFARGWLAHNARRFPDLKVGG